MSPPFLEIFVNWPANDRTDYRIISGSLRSRERTSLAGKKMKNRNYSSNKKGAVISACICLLSNIY